MPQWIERAEWLDWPAPLDAIRGESHYQEALRAIAGEPCEDGYLMPVAVNLVREPNNAYDTNALRAEVRARLVGYLARELAEQLSPALDAAGLRQLAVAGVIRGGFILKSGDAASYGVHIWLDRRLSPGPAVTVDEQTREGLAASWSAQSLERWKEKLRGSGG